MMKYISPELSGISSDDIKHFIDTLEAYQLSTHDIIIARGDNIVFEKYWKPFHKNYLHRMYSVSKSIVALAVGFLIQDGLLSLNDKISKFFASELEYQPDKNMHNQTIRDMLMMSTSKPAQHWFDGRPKDRVRYYFENGSPYSRPPGTIFQYDSTGSFVLCALAERLTNMPFMEYLRIKLFDKIGVSKEAYCLKCPGGHSWGDSGIICTARDLLLIARFFMNKGNWNGEQILNEAYMTEAVSKQIDNSAESTMPFKTFGYGYYVWRTAFNSYSLYGMGCQFAVLVPDKDIILIYNGDNQGNPVAEHIVFESFFNNIANNAVNYELLENKEAEKKLSAEYELMAAKGCLFSDFQNRINEKEYILKPNPMGITHLSLSFFKEYGQLKYKNAQGEKTINFGMGKNIVGIFPQEGYSNLVGGEKTKGFYYRCAASAAWTEPKKLFIKVQIIDIYFGRLNITISFADENSVGIYMSKTAEDFLNEYEGFAEGTRNQ